MITIEDSVYFPCLTCTYEQRPVGTQRHRTSIGHIPGIDTDGKPRGKFYGIQRQCRGAVRGWDDEQKHQDELYEETSPPRYSPLIFPHHSPSTVNNTKVEFSRKKFWPRPRLRS